jgi:hypoxanthine phosphoribosyltransferase
MAGRPSSGLDVAASLVYSAAEIDRIVQRMAAEIAADLATANPIVIPILIGGAFTAVRLTAYFEFPYDVDSVRVARFGPGRFGGKLHWYAKPCLDLNGREVLIVDDVLERGYTLRAVEHELSKMNAAGIHTAVLFRKQLDPTIERPAVDYVGADAPDRYLFGCGMDLDGRWRGLPALYAVDEEARDSTL